ncbi:Ser/Thr protein phosphatase superfamily protein [Nannizzia gypsea CBS 118893]|uniref:Ser/Thr protein phosphatase superfamily protein n=1 Tax=Arthroderma gypseum (strain ATCC MYA-4604 / CBS 118893) TaxID=535722 RepID=E5R291_ARTGP|nr:Ser/Thr protein phosphatase superfamily protein [Nannizzia gypsea CBS 118893]EFQ96981.1 Ser/Thr protein phosphatase superfamily protein [Nannizzia gypsea CBS 118893]
MGDFQIISDLHLETHPAYDFVIERTAPYLALLGDVGHLEHDQFFPYIEELLSRFEIVFLLFGNHEPQSFTMDKARRRVVDFQDRLPPSTGRFVFLSQTRFDVSDSLTVLGCTLYSHILPEQDQAVAARMSDFKMITDWTTETHNRAHDADLAWLNAQVRDIEQREPHRRIAIFSHHAPSLDPRAVDPKYAGSSVTSGFATDLRDQPCWTSSAVTAWAFGHTHYNCDFELGGVRVIANQKGYYATPRDTFIPGRIYSL